MDALVGTPSPGSIGEYLDAHEGEPVDSVADAVIERWPNVLAPCSWTEPGHGQTKASLKKLIAVRRAKRAGQAADSLQHKWAHESEGLNASSEYPDV
jgi:hypothetical protein